MTDSEKKLLNTYADFNNDSGKWEFYSDDLSEFLEKIKEKYKFWIESPNLGEKK